jgi:hypothetical protein
MTLRSRPILQIIASRRCLYVCVATIFLLALSKKYRILDSTIYVDPLSKSKVADCSATWFPGDQSEEHLQLRTLQLLLNANADGLSDIRRSTFSLKEPDEEAEFSDLVTLNGKLRVGRDLIGGIQFKLDQCEGYLCVRGIQPKLDTLKIPLYLKRKLAEYQNEPAEESRIEVSGVTVTGRIVRSYRPTPREKTAIWWASCTPLERIYLSVRPPRGHPWQNLGYFPCGTIYRLELEEMWLTE